jgi:SNF2 family DNA or RNA helicase
MYLRIKDEDLMAETAAGLIAKLQQLSSGSVYGEDKEVIHVHTAKMDALLDIIEEANGQSVLIVYQFKHTLSRLRKKLGINFADVRDPRAIDDWNKGDLQLMGLHPASGGHGLNLQAGGHIIVWFDQTYNLEHYQQANARLHRQGQEHPVMVHRLICTDTIDSVVLQSLTDKTAVQDILMEGLK